MADSRIKITLRGDMPSGTIELRKLSKFAQDFQNAVDEMAYSIQRNRGSRAERKQITYETSLSLTGIGEGSTDLELAQIPKTAMPIYRDLADDAVEHLIIGIDVIRQYEFDLGQVPALPDGWDERVVRSLNTMGKVFAQGIDEVELRIITPNRTRQAVYDKPVQAKLQQLLSEDRERIDSVTGRLLLIDYVERKNDTFLCRIYPDIGSKDYVTCYFEEDIADFVQESVRKTVGAVGIARYDSITGAIKHFTIKELIVLKVDGDLAEFDAQIRDSLQAYRAENDTLSALQEAWEQLAAGEARDISTLWDDFDDD